MTVNEDGAIALDGHVVPGYVEVKFPLPPPGAAELLECSGGDVVMQGEINLPGGNPLDSSHRPGRDLIRVLVELGVDLTNLVPDLKMRVL